MTTSTPPNNLPSPPYASYPEYSASLEQGSMSSYPTTSLEQDKMNPKEQRKKNSPWRIVGGILTIGCIVGAIVFFSDYISAQQTIETYHTIGTWKTQQGTYSLAVKNPPENIASENSKFFQLQKGSDVLISYQSNWLVYGNNFLYQLRKPGAFSSESSWIMRRRLEEMTLDRNGIWILALEKTADPITVYLDVTEPAIMANTETNAPNTTQAPSATSAALLNPETTPESVMQSENTLSHFSTSPTATANTSLDQQQNSNSSATENNSIPNETLNETPASATAVAESTKTHNTPSRRTTSQQNDPNPMQITLKPLYPGNLNSHVYLYTVSDQDNIKRIDIYLYNAATSTTSLVSRESIPDSNVKGGSFVADLSDTTIPTNAILIIKGYDTYQNETVETYTLNS